MYSTQSSAMIIIGSVSQEDSRRGGGGGDSNIKMSSCACLVSEKRTHFE